MSGNIAGAAASNLRGLRATQQRLKQKLLRIRAHETRIRVARDLFAGLHADVLKRKMMSLRDVATGPNFLLLASCSLLGTAVCWILGDLIHWSVGLLFALLGLIVSVAITARVAFNASILSPAQISATLRVFDGLLQSQKEKTVEIQAELTRLEPLIALELNYEAECRELQSKKSPTNPGEVLTQVADENMRRELRKTGIPPTEKQIKFAKHLGIPISGQESRDELSFAITLVTSRQTPEEELLSRVRWSREYSNATDSIRKACLDQIILAIQTNKDCGYQFVRGFVLVRGSDCGDTHHGTFIRVKNALSPLTVLPPFTDCAPANCTCEIVPVLKGTTAKDVLNGHVR